MDDIEQYIRNNAPNWDDKKAPPSTWDNIEQVLDQPNQVSSKPDGKIGTKKTWIGSILAVVILLSVGGYFWLAPNDQIIKTEKSDSPLLYAELESFQETEQYYLSAIFASQVELDAELKDETLNEDLKALDKIDIELRREYKNAQGIYREQILRELIHNHQTKLNLMLDVLDMIKEQNKIEENVF